MRLVYRGMISVVVLGAAGVAVAALVSSHGATPAAAGTYPTPNSSDRAVIAARAKDLAQYEAKLRQAAASPHPLAPLTPGSVPLGTVLPGIAEDQGAYYQVAHIAPNNVWHGVVGGQQVAVHAGSVGTWDPAGGAPVPNDIGVLVVDSASGVVKISNPTVPGPFTIIAISGSVITIEGSNKATFGFDVMTDAVRN